MALDVFVMPLWKFKAGDFTSPIEQKLGIKPTVISLSEPLKKPRSRFLRLCAWLGIFEFHKPPSREERKVLSIHEVDDLKSELTRLAGKPINWNDDGPVAYRKQFHQPIVLRAFAAWHDHRDVLPEFTRAPENDYYKHPGWEIPKSGQRSFPTIVEHSLHVGYFIPVPFEGVHGVEPFKMMNYWDACHHVASTQTIMNELSRLLDFANNLPDSSTPEVISPVGIAKSCAEELQRICSLSIDHGLPVIFYG